MNRFQLTSARCAGLRKGFTLVELMVVIAILGTLAAIVLPQFLSATTLTNENQVKMSLHRARMQLELYYQQHHNIYPALAEFEQQMTLSSDANGNTAPPGTPGFPFGPYIFSIPINSFTGSDTVGDGGIGSSDWYYDGNTGEFRANDSVETSLY